MKERERQQRKEEMKTKIISKQQALLKETYKHDDIADYFSNNVLPSESSNSLDDESMVKVRITYLPQEDVQKQKRSKATVMKSDEKLSKTKYDKEDAIQIAESDRIRCEQNYFNTKSYPDIKSSKESNQNISKHLVKNIHLVERCKQNLRIEEQIKPGILEHSVSTPVLSNHISRSKSVASDPTGNVPMQRALSARSTINFAHKSCKLYNTHTTQMHT